MSHSKTDLDEYRDNNNSIDENKLYELEQEASNFVDEEFYDYAENVFDRDNHPTAKEAELRNIKSIELEKLNLRLLDENG